MASGREMVQLRPRQERSPGSRPSGMLNRLKAMTKYAGDKEHGGDREKQASQGRHRLLSLWAEEDLTCAAEDFTGVAGLCEHGEVSANLGGPLTDAV